MNESRDFTAAVEVPRTGTAAAEAKHGVLALPVRRCAKCHAEVFEARNRKLYHVATASASCNFARSR